MRRSGARALFDQLVTSGIDGATELVQSMLHHANPQQTQTYIGFTPSRHKRNDLIRGHQMYRLPEVTQLRREA